MKIVYCIDIEDIVKNSHDYVARKCLAYEKCILDQILVSIERYNIVKPIDKDTVEYWLSHLPICVEFKRFLETQKEEINNRPSTGKHKKWVCPKCKKTMKCGSKSYHINKSKCTLNFIEDI